MQEDHDRNAPARRAGDLARAIPVRDVPKWLPRQANGKRTHLATVYRWLNRGRRGVRLPSFCVGGRRYVHLEDLLDWIDRINAGETQQETGAPATTRQRRRQQERARRRVEQILGSASKRQGS